MPGSLSGEFGMWNNGHSCDRWVQVTIGDYCSGVNDGAQNQPFCRNGAWQSDAYGGATLNMIVAGSCGDGNAWCRDDPHHLDLAQPSLNRFVQNGSAVGDMYPAHWNNRHISWKFIPAPNYTGDVQIGFPQIAQPHWPALAVSHLPNGIHSVEYWANGAWQQATMDGDMGQAYIVGPIGASSYQIRVRDPKGTGTVDLSGGFHDAGDHVKFGLPQSYTASELALGTTGSAARERGLSWRGDPAACKASGSAPLRAARREPVEQEIPRWRRPSAVPASSASRQRPRLPRPG